jgi:hypothetical protein
MERSSASSSPNRKPDMNSLSVYAYEILMLILMIVKVIVNANTEMAADNADTPCLGPRAQTEAVLDAKRPNLDI